MAGYRGTHCETVVDCIRPLLPNGNVNVSDVSGAVHVRFSCLDGYVLVGDASAVCLANGRWNKKIPSCISKEINDAATVSDLSTAVANLSPLNFTSETAETVVTKLQSFTSNPDLTTSQVQEVVRILDTLSELALENERNVSVLFAKAFLEVAGKLLDSQINSTWLKLPSNEGAPALLASLEKFGRVVAVSIPTNDTQPLILASDNILLTVSAVSNSTVRNLSLPLDIVASNVRSTGAVYVPAEVLDDLLASNGKKQLAVVSLVFKNLEDLMPPTTTKRNRNASQSVHELRQKSEEKPHTSIVSLSIVEIGTSFSPNLELNDPIEINYMNIESVDNGNYTCSFWQFGSDSNLGYWSSVNVTTEIRSETNIVCKTFHLTSFCVMVSVQDPATSDALSYITYIGCGISLLCLFITLVFLVSLRYTLNCLMCYSVIALFLFTGRI
jgi:hypothetical protein